MRYVVLLRYGLWRLYAVLKLGRAQDGTISCVETFEPFGGMTWSTDGRYRLFSGTGTDDLSQRVPLASLSEPHVAYSIPGPRLLEERVPRYASDFHVGATVQISAHAVLEEPDRVELQLVFVPRGEQPYHRETVGDRRIDDGDPDIWVVLARLGDEPAERLVAKRVLRYPPPLRAATRPE